MEEYHIGKEIEKEVRKQYPTVDAFAKALHRERQTVYDLFKRAHIATDRLIEVSRLLNRDFLRELSEAYNNGCVAGDNTTTFQDTISQLLPEDELQVIETSRIAEVADEYFTCARKKPLLMFFDNGANPAPTTFRNVGKNILGVESIIQIDMSKPASVGKLQDLKSLPYVKAIDIWTRDSDIDEAINTARNIIKGTGLFVFIFCAFGGNHISKGYDGGRPCLSYRDFAEVNFKRWHDHAHIFVADNNRGDFVKNQKLYGSYLLYKDFPNFIDGDFEPLRKKLLGKHTFSIKYEDAENNISRCYITETEMMPWDRELFSECGVPTHSEIIYDISKDNGQIVGIFISRRE